MRTGFPWLPRLALAGVFFGVLTVAGAATSLGQAEASSGKVMVQFTQGAQVVASGFVYGDSSHVVTCLHVVAGGTSIQVVVGNTVREASVERVWRDSDLALLKLAEEVAVKALVLAKTAPARGAELVALGYPLGSPVLRSMKGELRQVGGDHLGDIIGNAGLRNEIKRQGFPSLQARVLDMQLPLTPGMSGGPVVDGSGALVGICNGGLENGTGELTWAIDARGLGELMASTDTNSSNVRTAAKTLFAAEVEAASGGTTVEVNGKSFTKLRTRTVAELTRFTEDPMGLAQLANEFAALNPQAWEFDVYRDLEGGASFVLPEGSSLRQDRGFATVSQSEGQMEMRIRYDTSVPTLDDLHRASLLFEQQVGALYGNLPWAPNPAWTYVQPYFYPNGLAVRRRSYVTLPLLYLGNPPVAMPEKYAFETFAAMNGRLLSVCALNLSYPGIFQDREQAVRWGKMVLAVQLASFSQVQE
jgi:hypothetical protein